MLEVEDLFSACVDHGLTYSCVMDSSSWVLCLSHEDLGHVTAVTQERWILEAGMLTHQKINPYAATGSSGSFSFGHKEQLPLKESRGSLHTLVLPSFMLVQFESEDNVAIGYHLVYVGPLCYLTYFS